jgi:hypothetical protein
LPDFFSCWRVAAKIFGSRSALPARGHSARSPISHRISCRACSFLRFPHSAPRFRVHEAQRIGPSQSALFSPPGTPFAILFLLPPRPSPFSCLISRESVLGRRFGLRGFPSPAHKTAPGSNLWLPLFFSLGAFSRFSLSAGSAPRLRCSCQTDPRLQFNLQTLGDIFLSSKPLSLKLHLNLSFL